MHCYLFEATAIQPYITDGGRLRDLVGASDLIERLCDRDGLLDGALAALGETGGRIRFSRRAAGVFFAFSEDAEAIGRLARLWPLLVQQHTPLLSFNQARGSGATAHEAFADAQPRLAQSRSLQAPWLPQAGPLLARNPRTGLVGVQRRRDGEVWDITTARKAQHARGDRLAARFADLDAEAWPINLSPEGGEARAFPHRGDSRYIAVVHADGNGLGQLLMDLSASLKGQPDAVYLNRFLAFSEAIGQATRQAAREATAAVLLPAREAEGHGMVPARPIVLGGDDLSVIVRADLAIAFTRAFLAAFSRQTEAALGRLRAEQGLAFSLPRLTACAGVAFVKASQPFPMAAALAESLCAAAKQASKTGLAADREVPASLAFHRVTTSLVDDYEVILAQELTTPGAPPLRHTLGAYAIEAGSHLPTLNDLLALQALLGDAGAGGKGSMRQLLGLLGRAPEQAQLAYRRWRELMRENAKATLGQFDRLMTQLTGSAPDDLPFGPIRDGMRHSPLGDGVALLSAGSELPAASQEREAA